MRVRVTLWIDDFKFMTRVLARVGVENKDDFGIRKNMAVLA